MRLFLFIRRVWFLLGPLLFSWMLFFGKEWKCIYVILIVSSFWILDVLPLGITSLLPMFFFPIFQILSSSEVSRSYLQDSSALFMFSLIMALAVQQSGLHRRLALGLLVISGPRRKCVLLMLASATAFMSFFLSDTASTALSLPIAMAIIETLQSAKNSTENPSDSSIENSPTSLENLRMEQKNGEIESEDNGFCKALLLVCAQASQIGGTGIITGCAPNVMFRDQLQMMYPSRPELSYLSWMSFSAPLIPLYILSNVFVVIVVCIGFSSFLCCNSKSLTEKEISRKKEKNERMAATIKDFYHNLGPFSFAEISVIFWFIFLLSAWISRSPGFIAGWGSLLGKGNEVSDATVAVLVSAFMFIWPKTLSDWSEPILDWQNMKDDFPWAVLFFVGSGSALSEGVKASGLADYAACVLAPILQNLSPFWLQVTFLFVTLLIVEVAGNVPTAGVVIPIVLAVCRSFSVDPLYIGLPCTLAVSYTFILPHSCASNTIIMETNLISRRDFLLTGSALKVFCLLITVLNFNTYAHWVLNIEDNEGSLRNSTLTSFGNC